MDFALVHLLYHPLVGLVCLCLSCMVFCVLLPVKPTHALPHGSYGWPFFGETIELLSYARRGTPGEFIKARMRRHNNHVFKTSLFRERTAILCGPAGNKLLFTSEKKLVLTWWPASLKKVFGRAFPMAPYEEAMGTRKLITGFLRGENLQAFVGRFDSVCKESFRCDWVGKEKVVAFPLVKKYAFSAACEMFASINDDKQRARLLEEFTVVARGAVQVPIYFPGTRLYKAVKSSHVVRRELLKVIERKRTERALGSRDVEEDLISHLMEVRNDKGELLTDEVIADNAMVLMAAGHVTSSSTMMLLIKYLAEMPECYRLVFEEQREIRSSKRDGELLNKDDLKKMSYSLNVVNEVLRILPPAQGAFREAIADFSHAGFDIPKGWKVWWTVHSTHKNPDYFPEPEKFDPTRFEGSGPAPYTFLPFGGGPRLCPGKEFALMEVLVFLHNLVMEFSWKLVNPSEEIAVDPVPTPKEGLAVYLYPHRDICGTASLHHVPST